MMEAHPALRAELLERLRHQLGVDAGEIPPAESAGGGTPPPEGGTGAGTPGGERFRREAKGVVKRGTRKALGWYVEPTARHIAEDVVHDLRHLALDAAELRGSINEVQGLAINLELIKGELRALQETLDNLGWALAPGTGIEGAGVRVAELREKVNAIERRTREALTTAQPPAPEVAPPPVEPPTGPAVPAGERPPSRLFDYGGFERRFRGDPAAILEILRERYFDLLRDAGPVLDVGCGRGELLSALAGEGIRALGVDLDPDMVAEAREHGLEVHLADAVSFLRSRPEHSLGAVMSFHLVEHLELDPLIEFLELSVSRLRPGGVFIAETPNPASLVVLGNSYVLDPTHVRPLHPSLMAFLCESAGFRDIRLLFWSPAEDYWLPHVDAPDAPRWVEQVNKAFDKLNHTLFGPQEYSVVARTPAG